MYSKMEKTKEGLVLRVVLDDEQIAYLKAMIDEKINEFKIQLCDDCPYKEVTDNVIN